MPLGSRTLASSRTRTTTRSLVVQTPAQLTGLQYWMRADTGLSTNGAVSLASASSQYLSIVSNSTLQTGNVDFTVAGWVYVTSFVTGAADMVGKGNTSSNFEYLLSTFSNTPIFYWGTTGTNTITVSWGSALSTGTWYFIVARHSAANNTISIGVNNGTPVTASAAGGYSGTGTQTVGAYIGSVGNFNGLLSNVGIWKSASGGGGCLSSTQITTLYNSGAGLDLRSWPSSLKTNLVSVYPFTIPGNLGYDAFGSNTLTLNNAPTYSSGPITYSPPVGTYLLSGEAVSVINDQSTNANTASQTTGASRYTQSLSQINGKPSITPASASSRYAISTVVLSGTWTLYAACNRATSSVIVPLGSSNGYPGTIFSDNNLYSQAESTSGTTAVAYTGGTGWILCRFRRDASNNIWFAATGMSEVMLGNLTGNFSPAFLFSKASGFYTTFGNQFAELFLTNTDTVNNNQDYPIRQYLNTRYALTIP